MDQRSRNVGAPRPIGRPLTVFLALYGHLPGPVQLAVFGSLPRAVRDAAWDQIRQERDAAHDRDQACGHPETA